MKPPEFLERLLDLDEEEQAVEREPVEAFSFHDGQEVASFLDCLDEALPGASIELDFEERRKHAMPNYRESSTLIVSAELALPIDVDDPAEAKAKADALRRSVIWVYRRVGDEVEFNSLAWQDADGKRLVSGMAPMPYVVIGRMEGRIVGSLATNPELILAPLGVETVAFRADYEDTKTPPPSDLVVTHEPELLRAAFSRDQLASFDSIVERLGDRSEKNWFEECVSSELNHVALSPSSATGLLRAVDLGHVSAFSLQGRALPEDVQDLERHPIPLEVRATYGWSDLDARTANRFDVFERVGDLERSLGIVMSCPPRPSSAAFE